MIHELVNIHVGQRLDAKRMLNATFRCLACSFEGDLEHAVKHAVAHQYMITSVAIDPEIRAVARVARPQLANARS